MSDTPSAPTVTGLASGITNQTSLTFYVTPSTDPSVQIDDLVLLDNGQPFAGTVEALRGSDAPSGGIWTVTVGNLGDGPHKFTVKTLGVDGGSSVLSAESTAPADALTVATAQPTATVSESAPAITNQTSDTIYVDAKVGSADLAFDSIGTVEIWDRTSDGTNHDLGAAAYDAALGKWRFDASGLTQDMHSFTAVVTDAANNSLTAAGIGGAPVTVIVTAPPTPAAPSAPTVTGLASGITNQTSLTFYVTPSTDPSVQIDDLVLLDNGQPFAGTVEALRGSDAPSGGIWTVTVGNLGDGPHKFTVKTLGVDGGSSVLSAESTAPADALTVATAQPTATVSESAPAITNQTSDTIYVDAKVGSADLAFDSIGTVEIWDRTSDGTNHDLGAAAYDAALGKWRFDASGLTQDMHSFTAVVTDAANNSLTAAGIGGAPVTVIVTAPPTPAAPSAPTVTGLASGITNQTSLTFYVTPSTDPSVQIDDLVLLDNGQPFAGTVEALRGSDAPSGGIWTVTVGNLGDGPHKFTVKTLGVDGGSSVLSAESTAPADALTVATAQPTATVSESAPAITNQTSDTIYVDAKVGSADLAFDSIGTVEIWDRTSGTNHDLGAAAYDAALGKWRFDASGLTQDMHSFTAVVTDAANNSLTAAGIGGAPVTVIVTAPPTPAAPSAPTVTGLASGITNQTSLTFYVTPSTDPSVQIDDLVLLDNGQPFAGTVEALRGSDAPSGGIWTVTVGNLGDGPHKFTVKTLGVDGGSSVLSAESTAPTDALTVATAQPTATVSESAPRITNQTSDTIYVDAKVGSADLAFDSIGTVEIWDRTSDGTNHDLGAAAYDAALGKWRFDASGLTQDMHSFTAIVTDAANNSLTAAGIGGAPVTVIVTAPPTPLSITISNTGGNVISSSQTISGTILNASQDATIAIYDNNDVFLGEGKISGNNWYADITLIGDPDSATGYKNSIVAVVSDKGTAASSNNVDFNLGSPPTVSVGLADDTSSGQKDTSVDTLSGQVGNASQVSVSIASVTANGIVPFEAGSATITGDTWTFSPDDPTSSGVSNPLPDGSYIATATVATPFGKTDDEIAFTVQKTPPSAVATITALSSDTGVSSTDFITDVALQIVSGTYTGTLNSGDNIQVSVDGGNTWVDTRAGNGIWTAEKSVTLQSGTNNLEVRTIDQAGNKTPIGTHSYTLDTEPPSATSGLLDCTGSDGWTTNDTLTGSCTPGGAVDIDIYGPTGLAFSGPANVSGNTWSLTPTGLSGDDVAYTVKATETDLSGLTGVSATKSFIYSTVNPPISPDAYVDRNLANMFEFQTYTGVSLYGSTTITLWGTNTFTMPGIGVTTSPAVEGEIETAYVVAVDPCGHATFGTYSYTFENGVGIPGADQCFQTDDGDVQVSKASAISGGGAPGATVDCSIDGGQAATVTANSYGDWTYTPASMSYGLHSVKITESNASGVLWSATQTYDYSNGSPVTLGLVSEVTTSTGIATRDDALTGTALPGLALSFTVDGVAQATSVKPLADGSWSWTPTDLRQGDDTIAVTQTDANGNPVGSASIDFTYDTTPPATTISLFDDTGASATDNVTNDDKLAGGGDANTLVTFTENDETIGTTTSDTSGSWSFTPTNLSQGQHTITASETDAAGNVGAASLTFTYDTTPPSATTIALVQATGPNGATDDDALTGVGEDNAFVSLSVGDDQTTIKANASGKWSWTPPSLTTGDDVVSAFETDLAGNVGPTSSLSFFYDGTPPSATATIFPGANVLYAGENATSPIDIGTVTVFGGYLPATSVALANVDNAEFTLKPESGSTGVYDLLWNAGAALPVASGSEFTITGQATDTTSGLTASFAIGDIRAEGTPTIELLGGSSLTPGQSDPTGGVDLGAIDLAFADGSHIAASLPNLVSGSQSFAIRSNPSGAPELWLDGGLSASSLSGMTATVQVGALQAIVGATNVIGLPIAGAIALRQQGLPILTPVSVFDTPSDIASTTSTQASALEADGYVALSSSGGTVALTVTQASFLASYGLRIATPATVTLTASAALAVTTSQASAIKAIGATLQVQDTATAIDALTAAQIATLATLGVSSIAATSGTIAVTVAQTAAFEGAEIKLSSTPGAAVYDGAAQVAAMTPAQILGLSAIGITEVASWNRVIDIGVADAAAFVSADMPVTSVLANPSPQVYDTGADIALLTPQQIVALPGLGFLKAITSTTATVDVDLAQEIALEQAGIQILTPSPHDMTLVLSEADVPNLNAQDIGTFDTTGLNEIAFISISGAVSITAAQALDLLGDGGSNAPPIPIILQAGASLTIADTAANIEALTTTNILKMASFGISGVQATSGALSLYVYQAEDMAADGWKVLGANQIPTTVPIVDTGSMLGAMTAAQIAAVAALGGKTFVTTTTGFLYNASQTDAMAAAGVQVTLPNGTGLGETFDDGATFYVTPEPAGASVFSATNGTVALSVTDNGGTGLSVTSGGETLYGAASTSETLQASTHVADAISLLGTYGAATLQYFGVTGSGADSLTLQASAFSYLTPGMTSQAEAAAVLGNATGATNAVIADSQGDTVTFLGVSAATLKNNPGVLQFA